MENEYSVVFNETTYTAKYYVDDNTVSVCLPNGDNRETTLNGLKPETAVRNHLMSYVKSIT